MSFSYSQSNLTFTVGERGGVTPSAEEFVAGSPVVNQYENIELRLLNGSEGDIDRSVEPPVVRLRRAVVKCAFGEFNNKGEFVQLDGVSLGEQRATGVYSGVGSQLSLSRR
jgi:hypothetical protein